MSNPVVLITGALTGIGRAAAVARKGAKVVVAGRRDEAGKALVKELRSLGSEAEFINTDVRKDDDVRALVDKTIARFWPSRCRSFGQPRFPESLRQQRRVCLPAPGDPRRDCKGGINLKETRRRLTRLGVTSEMGESGRETAVWFRIDGVLTLGFLPCDDSLVKAEKLDEGIPHPDKRMV